MSREVGERRRDRLQQFRIFAGIGLLAGGYVWGMWRHFDKGENRRQLRISHDEWAAVSDWISVEKSVPMCLGAALLVWAVGLELVRAKKRPAPSGDGAD